MLSCVNMLLILLPAWQSSHLAPLNPVELEVPGGQGYFSCEIRRLYEKIDSILIYNLSRFFGHDFKRDDFFDHDFWTSYVANPFWPPSAASREKI